MTASPDRDEASTRPQTLSRLTSLRAVAAMLVFGYHVGHDTAWIDLRHLFDKGFVGVAFFFILSGFVLTWSTRPSATARNFYLKRFARIYPSHALMALVAMVVPATALPLRGDAVVPNFLLVQSWSPRWDVAFGLNAVSWSLSNEAFFYLLAPGLIVAARRRSTRALTVLTAMWLGLCSAAAILMGFASNQLDVYAYTNPLVRSGEFVLGILLATLVARGARVNLPLWAPVFLLLLLAVLTRKSHLPQSVIDVLFVLPFALLVVAAASADLSGGGGLMTHRISLVAGEVSFAFYLVHELVILQLEYAFPQVSGGGQGLALASGAFLMSCLGAAALHYWVEKPMQRVILGRARKPYLRSA